MSKANPAIKKTVPEPATPKAGAPPEVTIWTDGGCIVNPGPGGYGAVLLYKNHRKELSGGFRRTTIHSDSQYLVNAIEQGWARRWQAHGWWRNRKEKAINPDLWERLLALCDLHDVKFRWVRGHAGSHENERADQLARAAATGRDLAVDEMYERAPPADPARLFWK